MEELVREVSTKIDAGLALLLIVMTGIIMFWIGLITPFVVARMAKLFRFSIDLGDLYDKDDDAEE